MASDTLMEAWGNGIRAAFEQTALTEIPYPEGTRLAEIWAKGWQRGVNLGPTLPEAKSIRS